MGLDRLRRLPAIAVLVLVVSGCDDDRRPDRLLHGQSAVEFAAVPGSVVSIARVLRGTTLGRRYELCRPDSAAPDALVVERIGVFAESLTFADRRRRIVHSCDGGHDAAGERAPPWCSSSAGLLFEGRLLDPRLDVACRDRNGRPVAYAWVEPVAGARWIGVDQGSYVEIYEVLGGLPVRIAADRNIDLQQSRARFDVTQYDGHGRALIQGELEAAVAG